jgi:uncharacterized protein
MIVDVHTHTPAYRDAVPEDKVVFNSVWRPDRAVKATTCWADYMEAMGPADKSIVFGIAWHPGGSRYDGIAESGANWYEGNLNDAAATFVRAHPDRLIGFMALHPHDRDCLDELERCRSDLGLRGIKLGANYQNFDPLEARALAIYERAQRYGLPILFHQGTSPVREAPIKLSHPLLMDEIAIRYPDLKIIMAHVGHPWQVDTCVVIRKHPNVYADISANFYRPWSYYNALRLATEWGVLPKLLFGSDFPIATPQETLDALWRVNDILDGTKLPRVPEEELAKIPERDSLGLLGLE